MGAHERLVGFVVAAALAGTLAPGFAAATTTAPPPIAPEADALEIVLLREGVEPESVAREAGVTPAFVYRDAVRGFAGQLTDAQLTSLTADARVVMAVRGEAFGVVQGPGRDDREHGPSDIETVVPQRIGRGNRRVGVLSSPTARVDGRDDPLAVDVAVLDSGIEVEQPDLDVRGGVDCTGGGSITDPEGHGTHVAGIVGARDNGFGLVGVAPGARLWSVRVLDPDLLAGDAQILCGLDWVARNASVVEVANLSFGGPGLPDDGACGLRNRDPMHLAVCGVVRRGVTVVVAAGNEAADVRDVVPANYPEVITVSGLADTDGAPGGLGGPVFCGTERDDTFASFSNYGSAVDLAAPSWCVGSTFIGRTIRVDSGTSFGAPFVSGAAALYKVRHPAATPEQVRAGLVERRERTRLAGDPDRVHEGVLDVRGL